MSAAILYVDVLPLEERGWRVRVLVGLVEYCLSVARMVYQSVQAAGPRESKRGSWSRQLGRMVRLMNQLVRLAEQTRDGIPPSAPVAHVRNPVLGRRSRSHPLEPYGQFSLGDSAVPAAETFRLTLAYLLAEPDVAVLVAADHRAARLLRSLCRLCGVRPEDVLYPMDPPRVVDAEPLEETGGGSGIDWAALAASWPAEPGAAQDVGDAPLSEGPPKDGA